MPDDKLKLKIKAEVGRSGSIATLADNLKKLKDAANSSQIEALGKSMEKLAKGLEAMRNAPTLNANTVKNLVELTNTLKGLQEIPDMSNLETLSSLKAIEGVKINKPLVNNIKSLVDVANQIKGGEIAKLGLFATALQELNNVNIPRTLGTLAKNMGPMIEATKKLDKDFAPKIRQLSKALTPLSKLPKSQLSSYITPLSKLGKAIVDINNTKLSEMEKAIKKVQELLRQVDALDGAKLQKITGQPAKRYGGFGAGGGGSGKDFDFWARAGLAFVGLKSAFGFMGKVVAKSNEYVENMNLFTVAMGEYAEEAEKYADRVQEALGVDKSDWIRAQGMYKQILSGFGVEADQAYSFSKILTQLTYDMASFYNISEQLAQQKLASGISGELEPLRRLGYALDQATLQQLAYSQGINILVRDMTQAEKAQLRMLAIYQQSKNAMGDMSRTILTPANAMRVLTSTVNRAARAIANSLIPIIMALMPYLQALAELVIMVANAIATWLGFELPTIDYSDIKGNVGGLEEDFNAVGDAAEGATAKAKEFKAFLAGFDELHVIPEPPKDAGGGGKGGGPAAGGGPRFKLDIPDYDFLQGKNSKVKAIVDKVLGFIEKIKKALGPVWDMLVQIGKGILGWLGFSKIGDFIASILGIEGPMKNMIKGIAVVAGSAILGFWETYKSWRAYYNGEISGTELFLRNLGTFIGQFIPTFVAFLQMGVPLPIALGLAAIIGILTQIVGWYQAWKDHHEQLVKDKFFGEIKLELEEIADLVEDFTTTEYTIALRVAVDAIHDVENAKKKVENMIHQLDVFEVRARLGIETDVDRLGQMINQSVEAVQEYADKNIQSIVLNYKLAFGDGPTTDSLIKKSTARFAEWDSKVGILQQELMEVLGDANLPEDYKRQKAMEIASQIQEIYLLVEEYMRIYEQNKTIIELGDKYDINFDPNDIEGLDFDSLIAFGEELNSKIKEQIEKHEEHVVNVKTQLKTDYDTGIIGLDEYKKLLKEKEATFPYEELSIRVRPIVEGMEALAPELLKSIADALENVDLSEVQRITLSKDSVMSQFDPVLTKVLSDLIEAMDGDPSQFSLETFRRDMRVEFDLARRALAEESDSTADAVKGVMKKVYEAIYEPQMADVNRLTKILAEQGQVVDDLTRDFYKQAAETAALAGEDWAVDFMAGFDLAGSEHWVDFLKMIKEQGGEVPEHIKMGMLANMGVMLEFYRNMTEGPEKDAIADLFELLGFSLGDAEAKGYKSGREGLENELYNTSLMVQEQLTNTASYGEIVPITLQQNMNEPTKQVLDTTIAYLYNNQDTFQDAMNKLGESSDKYKEAFENAKIGEITEEEINALLSLLEDSQLPMSDKLRGLADGTLKFNEDFSEAEMDATVREALELVMLEISSGTGDIFDLIVNYEGPLAELFAKLVKWYQDLNFQIQEAINKSNTLAGMSPTGGSAYGNSGPSAGGGNVRQHASGGFPDMGQMFIAREAGPELVGSIGSRTAVANNFQIVSGISHGVFAATSSAMANFASGMGQLLRSMNSPVYRRYDTEQDGANEDRITREDFNYGLGVLTQAIVGAIQESNDQEIKIDDEAIGRVVRRQMHRVSTVEG